MNVGNWYSIKINGQIIDAIYTGTTNDGKHVLRYSQNNKLNVGIYSESELKNIGTPPIVLFYLLIVESQKKFRSSKNDLMRLRYLCGAWAMK